MTSTLARLDQIRRRVITAVCSDDRLFELLVLKGGNALRLVHGLGSRASLDVDFSLEGDFPDVKEARERFERALVDRFAADGYVVFDFGFEPKPPEVREGVPPTWGGYLVTFKLIEKARFEELGGEIEAVRRQAEEVLGPNEKRVFRVEISKHEHCVGKAEVELDGFSVYVYTPAMIAAEKLRAICQQMPGYPLVAHPRARARDFYDIHAVFAGTRLDGRGTMWRDLVREIFAAKDVPLSYLKRIEESREFHRPDWAAVRGAVFGELQDFDFYYDFVVELARELSESFGVE